MNNRREINRLAVEIIEGTHEIVSHKTTNNNAQKIFSLSLPIELNENQQIVLEWLQGDIQKRNPFASIKNLVCRTDFDSDSLSDEVKKAYNKLDKNQEFHVLRMLGEWGLGQDGSNN